MIFAFRFSPALRVCGLLLGPLPATVAYPADQHVPAPAERRELATPLGKAMLAPPLRAAAERDGIALTFSAPAAGVQPAAGDSVVAWVGTSDEKGTRQWLVQLRRAAAPGAGEKTRRAKDVTKYLSWGPVVTFKSDSETLEVWMAGPVDGGATTPATVAPVQRLRVRVPGDYLRLGLDRSAMIDMHFAKVLRAAAAAKQEVAMGHIYAMEKPIKPENIAWAKPVAEQLGFTPELERAWIGGTVALGAFYDLANDTPALRRIAEVAVQRPPLWKLAKVATGTMFKSGVGNGQSQPVDPGSLGMLPIGQECFRLPFGMAFGDDPMVWGEMIVTSPVPPLDVSAGVLGMVAVHPKDPRRMVHVVLLGAQNGGRAAAAVARGK